MEFVASTFLSEPLATQNKLVKLTLSPSSGMSRHITQMRLKNWPDVPILYVKDDSGSIVAWCLCSPIPRTYINRDKSLPEIQVFVAEDHRRKGIGSILLNKAASIWGTYVTCPWDEISHSFFKKNGKL